MLTGHTRCVLFVLIEKTEISADNWVINNGLSINNVLLEADDKGLLPGSPVFLLFFGDSIEEIETL